MALHFKDGEITGSSGVAKAGLTLGIIGTALASGIVGNGGLNVGGGLLGGNCANTISALESTVAELKAMRYTDYVGMDLYRNIVQTAKEEDAKIGAVQKELLQYVIELDKQTALNKQASDYQFMIMNNKIDCCCDKANMTAEFNQKINALADASILSYVNSTFIPGTLKLPITSIVLSLHPLLEHN
jgi:beta-N-acetylglucosaminidase